MSNYKYEGYGVIRDLKSDIPYHTDGIVDLLEEKDMHIKELEHRLCIESKFKTYQQVYTISKFYTSTNGIPEYEIFNSYYYVAENKNEIIVGWNYKKDFNQRKYYYIRKDWVFATEAEAKAKLMSLKMSKDIKKALEHCVEWNCDNCPNREELGGGDV